MQSRRLESLKLGIRLPLICREQGNNPCRGIIGPSENVVFGQQSSVSSQGGQDVVAHHLPDNCEDQLLVAVHDVATANCDQFET